jgi:hypothetical protein
MEPPVAGESYAARLLNEAGVSVNVAVTTFSFVSMPDLVRGTSRIALVQSRLAQRMVEEAPGLKIAQPPLYLAPLEQVVQWHSMRSSDPGIQWLRREMRAAALE